MPDPIRFDPEPLLPLPSASQGAVGRLPRKGGPNTERVRHPEWLKIRLASGPNFSDLKQLMRGLDLHTVCEEARCPNIHECWENRTATFMILGGVCTRACKFCAVRTGRPSEIDLAEPARVARAVARLGLRHVVVTSVARDDLYDGGAYIFAETIRAIRAIDPTIGVEVLIPDFAGRRESLETVLEAGPDILNHNIETVERLTPRVRSKATYARSLELLARAKELAPQGLTKSGLMLGLGETRDEIVRTLSDLRQVEVDVVTIGQYLRPTLQHLPIERYVPPAEFEELRKEGMRMGFLHVESGPLVRSSYHARDQVPAGRRSLAGVSAAREDHARAALGAVGDGNFRAALGAVGDGNSRAALGGAGA